MAHTPIYEFDALVAAAAGVTDCVGLRTVPPPVFSWLEAQALRLAEVGEAPWLRLTQRRGRRAVQVTHFVGVIRAPDGYQIEVLPKVGKAIGGGDVEARQLLIEMLRCLGGFRHIQTDSAKLFATRMPLLEVFIAEFLRAVEHLVKRGLRSDYRAQQDNLFALRGKLQMAAHLRHNLCRRDRFFAEFDEFSPNRPENRLLHAALKRVLAWTASQASQQLARELCFVFADVPASEYPDTDFQRVRLDRGMAHYEGALAWARLILEDESPLTGAGGHHAPSLLFPMEALFEAFVAKHLQKQVTTGLVLKTQARSHYLVRHQEQDWFRMKPDLLIHDDTANRLVLDTKWKLLDAVKENGSDKYGLSQADFYQLQAYGQSYLNGVGVLALVYPRTSLFDQPLPVFEFPKSEGLRLWVLPFCLRDKRLLLPPCGSLDASLNSRVPIQRATPESASQSREAAFI
jgi:5-methylcytosine-specific restriction enzyme subunit McrC